MESIEPDMPISDARANLTEVVNAVRLQDRAVRLSRRGKPQAAIVPVDVADRIDKLGGVAALRAVLDEYAVAHITELDGTGHRTAPLVPPGALEGEEEDA